MLHGMTSGKALRIAALIVFASLLSGPALAKSKVQDAALRQACIGAFGDQEHFDWTPRTGLDNALATCRSAIAQFPDDAEVQLYYAVARDQFAERGGTQDDNLYATEVYRRLADEGLPMAQYALGTMFDESAGVSAEEGQSYMTRARDGEFGTAVSCEAVRTFGLVDIDGNGPSYDIAAAESMAHGNYVCAGYLVNMYWYGYATPGDLPLSIADYARYAAVHGDPMAMAIVGLFYAFGTGSTDIDAKLQGQYTARQDEEKAGAWLLLAYWGTKSSMRPEIRSEFWDYGYLLWPPIVTAMQTTLGTLDLYDGPADGNFGDSTRAALAAFEASDVDALFQMVRAKEKYAAELGERELLHIGAPALD